MGFLRRGWLVLLLFLPGLLGGEGLLGAQEAERLYRTGRQAYQEQLYSLAYTSLTDFLQQAALDDPRADDAAYLAGVAALRDGQYGTAEEIFAAYGQRYPGSPYGSRSSYWLGVARYARERYLEAGSAFEAQLRVSGEPGYYWRSLRYAGACARLSGDGDKAERLFRRLLREGREENRKGDQAEALSALGKLYMDQGRFREARRELNTLIVDYPENSLARRGLYLLGNAFYEEGLWEEAEARYRRYLELYAGEEKTAQAAFRVVELARRRGAAGLAEEHLALLERHAPGSAQFAEARELIAGLSLELGRLERAGRIYRELLGEPGSDRASLLYHLGLVHEAAGETEAAGDCYGRAQEELGSPGDPDRHLLQRRIWKHQVWVSPGPGEARRAYQRLSEAYPRSGERYEAAEFLFESCREREDWDALEELTKGVLYSDPGRERRAEWAFRRGEVRRNRQLWGRALEDFRRAAEEIPEAQYQMGYIYTLRKEYQRADDVYSRLEKRIGSPGEGDDGMSELLARTRLARGICSYNLGRYEETRRRLNRLAQMSLGSAASVWRGQALFYRGKAEQKTGRLLASAESFEQAAEALSEAELRREAEYQLGWSYLQLQQYSRAREILERLAAEGGDGGRARLLAGRSYLQEGRWDEALGAFRSLLGAKAGGDVSREAAEEARFRVAQTLLRSGRDGELESYTGPEWREPRRRAWEQTAAEALEGGKAGRAEELYEQRLAEDDPASPEVYLKKSYAEEAQGKRSEAAQSLLEAARGNPEDPVMAAAGAQLGGLISGSRLSGGGAAGIPGETALGWLREFRESGVAPSAWGPAALAYARLILDADPQAAGEWINQLLGASEEGTGLHQSALILSAELALSEGQSSRAAEILEPLRLSRLSSVSAPARLLYGRLLLEQGKPLEAAGEWMRIYLETPEQEEQAAEGLYRAAQAYRKIPRPERAEKAEDRLKQGYPGSFWARRLSSEP